MYIETSVDIDINDILWEASKSEKKELFLALLEEFQTENYSVDFLKNLAVNPELLENALNDFSTPGEKMLNENLIKISNSYLTLSKEEEEIIEKIAKKH